jgi:hypothetical protein
LPRQETPARTPWWLLALRLAIAALLILAAAGPVLNPTQGGDARAPMLLVLDNGFSAAHDWRERMGLAVARIEAAGRDGRVVALLASADKPSELQPLNPAAALERLRAIKPQPHLPDRGRLLAGIERFLAATPNAEIVWISDGVAGVDGRNFVEGLARMAADRSVTVFKSERASALALAGAENAAGFLKVNLVRPEPNGRDNGVLRALI